MLAQHRFLENKGAWSVKTIKKIIKGKTGLIGSDGEDVFAGKFKYLRETGLDGADVYKDVLSNVFHAPAGGGLHLADIRGSDGELGLKVSGTDVYFGLIYIGDTSAFKKLVEADTAGVVLEEDAIAESLFYGINQPDSQINVLVGAKKFMEGWNSWRVANMGLLNIGRKEGSEIIQLFGRGVRLQGLSLSLKRSAAIDGIEHPPHIQLLETLNIFAVRANYMAQFRHYLEREGVETEGYVELTLKISRNKEFLKKNLIIPRVPEGRDFAKECDFLLEPDEAAKITVDMSLKVDSMRSSMEGVAALAMKAGQEQTISSTTLELLDWEAIYLELLEYKEQKGFHNLTILPCDAKRILAKKNLYSLIADTSVVNPKIFAEVAFLQEAVLSILRKYVEKYYRVMQQRWDTEHMVYQPIKLEDPNLEDYKISLPRSDKELIEAVKALIDEGERIYKDEKTKLPNIHFDRHLYQPLLVERGDKIKTVPTGLKESEVQFIEDVKKYVCIEKDKSLASKEIFLLRNLSRGKGVGFFENEGFYPDFILWVKEGKSQRIIFIEPHGMRQEKAFVHSDKAGLYKRLRRFSEKLSKRKKLPEIKLDSYIISKTPYEELRKLYEEGKWNKAQFAEKHILFFGKSGEYDYVRDIFDDYEGVK